MPLTRQETTVDLPIVGGGGASRISETNVHVAGIDEPDEVKTYGREIFLFSSFPDIYARISSLGIASQSQGETEIVKAFPFAGLAKVKDIKS